jgi:hypothetical protein
MKICILAPQFPFPEDNDVLHINNIARSLKRQGHTIMLVSYYSDNRQSVDELPYDKIYRIGRSTFVSLGMALWAFVFGKPVLTGFYFSLSYLAQFKKAVKKENPDLYISPFLWMTPYLNLCHLQDKSIVELPGTYSKTAASGSWICRMEKKRIVAYERKTISQYKKCVLVLRTDDACFSKQEPQAVSASKIKKS